MGFFLKTEDRLRVGEFRDIYTKLNRYSRAPTNRERRSESECAEGGRKPGKDERDV